jgi:transcriptional regulator with XRE-family HTH domain
MSRTKIEDYVIDIVKEKRLTFGYSQAQLAELMEISSGFIGKAESPKQNAKYNLNHINKLATIFNCSPQDFLPTKPKI